MFFILLALGIILISRLSVSAYYFCNKALNSYILISAILCASFTQYAMQESKISSTLKQNHQLPFDHPLSINRRKAQYEKAQANLSHIKEQFKKETLQEQAQKKQALKKERQFRKFLKSSEFQLLTVSTHSIRQKYLYLSHEDICKALLIAQTKV